MLIQHPSDLAIPIQFMDPKDSSQLTRLTIDYCRTSPSSVIPPRGPNPPQKKSEDGLIVQDLMVVVGVHLVI